MITTRKTKMNVNLYCRENAQSLLETPLTAEIQKAEVIVAVSQEFD